jgi:hypothetical protein
MTDAERFMQHYMEVWPSFDADRLDQAIDPEATIHHSGMAAPIRGADEPDYVRGIRGLMPDIGLEVGAGDRRDRSLGQPRTPGADRSDGQRHGVRRSRRSFGGGGAKRLSLGLATEAARC